MHEQKSVCNGVINIQLHSSREPKINATRRNYSKYFSVAVTNASSGKMNVAIVNGTSAILLITIHYTSSYTRA